MDEQKHEHDFSIVTLDWPHLQRSVTLRVCRTCGLTHRLASHIDGSWAWKPVIVWQEQGQEKANEAHA